MMNERIWNGTIADNVACTGPKRFTVTIGPTEGEMLRATILEGSNLVEHVRLRRSQIGDLIVSLAGQSSANASSVVIVFDPFSIQGTVASPIPPRPTPPGDSLVRVRPLVVAMTDLIDHLSGLDGRV
jgi:hypothetical protein